ncbi:MAG: xanthine dehydrogenase family protein subunit M [Desulfobacteraceae bacterium]|nr:MAG: xanthine dehydrogenase family protein subunit M [Desulfobacteraceae bacterium]
MFIRRLPQFEYHAPATIEEALRFLSQHGARSKLLAGGTDLLVSMKKRTTTPVHLVNLKGIGELRSIDYDARQGLRIGSLATIGDIGRSQVIREKFTALWDAADVMAAPQVRNLGTIGGNLCSAVPSADTAPPLIAMGASVRLLGSKGERILPVEKLFQGPGQSILEPDEILMEVRIPDPPEKSAGAYLKLMRRNAMDLALVGVAVFLRMSVDKGRCEEARIALGAVAPTPIRSVGAERVLAGKGIDEDSASMAGEAAAAEARPITDVRATEEYRRTMVGVLTKRATLEAFKRIR